MSELTVTLLGTTEIKIDKRPLRKFRATKVQALLIYLLVQAEQVHQREALMTLFWPDDALKSAQGSLRQTLHRLRQNIPDLTSANGHDPLPLILTDRQTVQINPDVVYSLDVSTFKTLLNSTQTHAHDSLASCPECEAKLKQIVALYQGDFLTDFYLPDSAPFEEWAMGKREVFRRQVLDVLETLSEIAFHRGDYLAAQQIARQHLDIDNLDERAYRQLMKSLAHHGQRHEALAVYESCAQLLADELGMQPAAQTTTLYEQIKTDDFTHPAIHTEGVRGYDLQEQIGAGSFGMVHKALQKGIRREVAVKIIHPHYANQAEFIRRFEQEAQLVAMLEHPHIVPLYDYWREPDGAYLVMRLMRGGNLSDAIKKSRWSMSSTLPLIHQIATALNTAHQQGIIHRDVKPANILLDEENNGYLSDFGIAKDLHQHEQLTQEQALLGSPSYISPEQILNEPVTDKTDQYSLGLVLYELLAGQPPYQENSLLDLMQKQVADPLPRLAGQSLKILPAVDEVIQRATAKRPSDRYPDILNFAQALQDACDPQSVEINAVKPVTVSPQMGAIENPYKGLRPFQEADAEMFYGRETLVDTLLAELETSRFLAVLGPSGSGKSSVVKAGLLPALRRGALPHSENWFIAQMIPGTHPLEELESALMHLAVNPPPSLIEPLQKDERGLVRVLKRILPQELDSEHPSQLLLFIDQFEELFTMVANDDDRQQFLDILLTAISEPYGRLRVVITLRADFYDRPLQQPLLGEWLRAHTQLVLPLTAAELETAVTAPAAQMGVTFQPGLAAAILADVNEQPGTLPLLQYALTELFERREGATLTHTAYQEIGGILGALGKRAEAIYEALSPTGKDTAQQLFLRLVTLGEGYEDTRRRVKSSELQAVEKGVYQENLMEMVIDEYGRHRLLTFDHDPVTREPTVEVAHEALLREWPRLRQWLDDSRNDVRQQRVLSISATEWDDSGQDEGFLLRGSKLSAIEAWAENTPLALTTLERSYVNASLVARIEREQAEETRRHRELETAHKLAATERQRADEQEEATAKQTKAATKLRRRAYYLIGLLTLALVAAFSAGWFAVENDQQAQALATQESIAVENLARSEQLRLASAAKSALTDSSFGDLATLLALRSLQAGYSPEADEALVGGLAQGFSHQLIGHSGRVRDIEFSEDGRFFVTLGSQDDNLILWDGKTGEKIKQLPSFGANTFALMPDGKTALIGGDTPYLYGIYDVGLGSEEQAIRENFVFWLNLETGEVKGILDTNGVLSSWTVAIDPQGDSFLIAFGHQVEIRDMQTEAIIQKFETHQNIVTSAVYTPDGKQIVTGSADQTVRVWDIQTGEELHRFTGHRGPVMNVAISEEGRYIASSSLDGTVRIIDLTTSKETLVLENGPAIEDIDQVTHQPIPFAPLEVIGVERFSNIGLTFSTNGSHLFTSGTDNVIRQWDVQSGQLLQMRAAIGGDALAITPDNTHLVTSNVQDIYLTPFTMENESRLFYGHLDKVVDVVISADDQTIVSLSHDQTARSWDMNTGQTLTKFILPQRFNDNVIAAEVWGERGKDMLQIGLLPDDVNVLIRIEAGYLVPWNTQINDSDRDARRDNLESIGASGFSENGNFKLIHGVVHSWGALVETQTGHIVQEFLIPPEVAAANTQVDVDFIGIKVKHDATVANDGQTVAVTFHLDNHLQLWDVESGEVVHELVGHTDWINEFQFSNDSQWIVSASKDGTARIWDVATGEELYRFTMPVGAVTAVEFSPDGRFLATGGDDNKARLWDIETGEQVRVFAGHEGTVNAITFTSDGQQILTASDDTTMRLWQVNLDEVIELACNRLARDFTTEERQLYGIPDDEATCPNETLQSSH